MNRNLKILLLLVGLAVIVASYVLRQRTLKNMETPAATPAPSAPVQPFIPPQNFSGDSLAPAAAPKIKPPPVLLTKENFEGSVNECLQDRPCDFTQDPWQIYLHFRDLQCPKVCESLIALMRRKMGEPGFRDQFKGPLLSMLEDFYSIQEVDFQRAGYYALLGELEKALRIYLDLEQRSAYEPSLHPAPKLSIANIYYGLHRLPEALPYYQAALAELKATPENLNDQHLEFIEKRIEEIQAQAKPELPASEEAAR